ncbi:serine kinase [Serratia rhizosphaerae]
MSDIDATLRWLDWWHSGFWRNAHPSWRQALPFPAPAAALARVRGAALRRRLGVADAALPRPQPQLLTLLALDDDARSLLLALVAEICTGGTALPGELKIWCRRLAKGLRPESWLPTPSVGQTPAVTSLTLLQARYPDCWPRLRMAFDHHDVCRCPPSSPALEPRRLQPLWEAALWQCQRTLTEDGEEHPHVAT